MEKVVFKKKNSPSASGVPATNVVRRGRGVFSQELRVEAEPKAPSSGTSVSDENKDGEKNDRFDFPIKGTGKEEEEVAGIETQTVREQLFRKERRRRHIVFVGDVKQLAERCRVKMFSFRGNKPLQIRHKFLRGVSLSLPTGIRLEDAKPIAIKKKDGEEQEDEEEGENACTEESTTMEKDIPSEELPIKAPSELLTAIHVGADGSRYSGSAAVYQVNAFTDLVKYFNHELLQLWSLEDVSSQRTSLTLQFGTAYVGTPRNDGNVDNLTFVDLVGKLNSESIQLHFLDDTSLSVFRAVDNICGPLVGAKYSLVKIAFFSQSKQQHLIARAVWQVQEDCFTLCDVENVGITFSWSIFGFNNGTSLASLKQHTSYPVELRFRSYHKNKMTQGHPVAGLANKILRRLTDSEHQRLRHGNTGAFESALVDIAEIAVDDDEYDVNSILVEHVDARTLLSGIVVDSTESLLIEDIEKLSKKSQMEQLEKETTEVDRAEHTASLGRGYHRQRHGANVIQSRVCSVHWHMSHDIAKDKNLEPLGDAFKFYGDVVNRANELDAKLRESGKRQEAPEAL